MIEIRQLIKMLFYYFAVVFLNGILKRRLLISAEMQNVEVCADVINADRHLSSQNIGQKSLKNYYSNLIIV